MQPLHVSRENIGQCNSLNIITSQVPSVDVNPQFYWGFVVLYYSSSVLCLVNNHLSICLFCFGYCIVCPSVSFSLTFIFQYTLLLLPGKEPDSLIECIWFRYYIYHAGYIKIILITVTYRKCHYLRF
jgi:hypothetical protein